MAERELEKEVIEVLGCIKQGYNFMLSGGAGSGKTYSLVSVVKEIQKLYPKSTIACITYTNAAAHEIEKRVDNSNLVVSTIHDFLWSNICNFQNELKFAILDLINNLNKIKSPNEDKPYNNNFENGISYKENLNISNGIISHDEVIKVSNYMYGKYVKLCDILKDKYQFIFVDEYQDTSPLVIEILLESLSKSHKKNIIGFFGDNMQSIYDGGVGDLNKYIENGIVKEVKKTQNRRNPQLVIDLANKIRTDGIIQVPSSDEKAPNMLNGKIKQGNIKFLYSQKLNINILKTSTYFDNWNFNDSTETKELRLTHNLIADEAGFKSLMDIYDKDPIINFKNRFKKYMKDQNEEKIDENETFDYVVKSVNWICKKRGDINEGRLNLDVLLDNDYYKLLYDKVKDFPYKKVMSMYFDKDNLISDKKEIDEEHSTSSKRDKLIRHLFKIEDIRNLYEDKQYNDFLCRTSYKIYKQEDKVNIKNKIEKLLGMENCSISEVINYADESNLCRKDDNLNSFIAKNDYLYDRVKEVSYSDFKKLYKYLEGYTPFSTQHKIKGMEFNNVLILLDNGSWNDYNFEYLLSPNIKDSLTKAKKNTFDRILLRTQKLFYVCCTRAKENLVVYCKQPTSNMIETAKLWFGEDNVINLDRK